LRHVQLLAKVINQILSLHPVIAQQIQIRRKFDIRIGHRRIKLKFPFVPGTSSRSGFVIIVIFCLFR
jgi:hypothetical protein